MTKRQLLPYFPPRLIELSGRHFLSQVIPDGEQGLAEFVVDVPKTHSAQGYPFVGLDGVLFDPLSVQVSLSEASRSKRVSLLR